MSGHSFFSPSGASRWLVCTGSQSLVAALPKAPEGEAAREGTFGHCTSEFVLTREPLAAVRDVIDQPGFFQFIEDELGFDFHPDDYLTDDLLDAIDGYLGYARRIPGERRVEVAVSLDHVIPGMSGTADLVTIEERDGLRILHVCDAKFGRGTRVYAERNPQLGLYAVGAIKLLGGPFHEVWLHIAQPRLGHYDQWCADQKWVASLVADVQRAYDQHVEGCGVFVPGEAQCRYCPAAGSCSAYAKWVKDVVALEFDSTEWKFADAISLPADELAIRVLPYLDAIEGWVASVRNHALLAAISGAEFTGFKLVEGTTRRRWRDEKAAADYLLREHGADDIYTRKLISISAAEKLLGKKRKDELAAFTEKPKGSATLVRQDDKRPAINPKDADLAEFDHFDA